MKINKIFTPLFLAFFALATSSCYDLDRNPLSEGSSENWFTTEDEFEASLKNMYQSGMWTADNESWTDDFVQRQILSSFANATVTGQTQEVVDYWENKYKGIGRANVVLMNLQRGLDAGIPQRLIDRFGAEAYFLRAAFYSMLIEKFGDVVYVDNMVSIEDALKMGRTPKSTLIPLVYEDYDKAIAGLPESTDYHASRATKGAAMAAKTKASGKMGVGMRIILFIAGIALILLCLRPVVLLLCRGRCRCRSRSRCGCSGRVLILALLILRCERKYRKIISALLRILIVVGPAVDIAELHVERKRRLLESVQILRASRTHQRHIPGEILVILASLFIFSGDAGTHRNPLRNWIRRIPTNLFPNPHVTICSKTHFVPFCANPCCGATICVPHC